MLLSLLFFWALNDEATLHPVNIQATGMPGITSVGAFGETVMLQTVRGQSEIAFFLHEMETGKTYQMGQNKLTKTVYRILPGKDGFVLFAHIVSQIYYLDEHGNYQDRVPLTDFEGAMPGMLVTEVFSSGPDEALASFEIADSNQLFIARLQLSQRTMEVIGNFDQGENEGQFGFVYPMGERLLHIDKLSGSARFIGADGQPQGGYLCPPLERTLRPGFKEVTNRMNARLKYQARILNPLPLPGGLSFDLISVFPSAYRKQARATWVLDENRAKRAEILTLHLSKDRKLLWDLVSGRLLNLPR